MDNELTRIMLPVPIGISVDFDYGPVNDTKYVRTRMVLPIKIGIFVD